MNVDEKRRQGLAIISISEIGSNHRALLMPNQDAVDSMIIDEDFVIAVSDGVGSCVKAQDGSAFAVTACINIFKTIKDKSAAFESHDIIEAIIRVWRSSVEPNNEDDYCATLKAIFKIGNILKAVSIGDGFIAVSSDGFSLLSPTEMTAFTNETNCLNSTVTPDDFWTSDFHLDTHKSYAAICCTDGVANGLLPGNEVNIVTDIEKNTKTDELKSALEELITDISEYCFDDKTAGVVKYEQQN